MLGGDTFDEFPIDEDPELLVQAAIEIERQQHLLGQLAQAVAAADGYPVTPAHARASPGRAASRVNTARPQAQALRVPAPRSMMPVLNGALVVNRAGGTPALMSLLDQKCAEVPDMDFFSPVAAGPRGSAPRTCAHEAQTSCKRKPTFQSPVVVGAMPHCCESTSTERAVVRARAAAAVSSDGLPFTIERAALDMRRKPTAAHTLHAAAGASNLKQPADGMCESPQDEVEESLLGNPPPLPQLDLAMANVTAGGLCAEWAPCEFDDDEAGCIAADASMVHAGAAHACLDARGRGSTPLRPHEMGARAPGTIGEPNAGIRIPRPCAPAAVDFDLTIGADEGDEIVDDVSDGGQPRAATAASVLTLAPRRWGFQPPVARPVPPALTQLAPNVSVPTDLAKQLRPHQRDGIVFLCNGISGNLVENQRGAVLADVPGLGKSAQVIGMLLACGSWLKKALIVCPVSLVDNWVCEFRKWAPDVQPPAKLLGPSGTTAIKLFVNYRGNALRVLIGSYERMRGDTQNLLCRAGIHVVVCDEAHRLKNAQTLEYKAVAAIGASGAAMVLITGTPVQNNAGEFFAMTNLALPGVLGSLANFKRKYEEPMASGEMSEELLRELKRETNAYVLRRGESILRQWLPMRLELLVFCKLTPAQSQLYTESVDRWAGARKAGEKSDSLKLVGELHKIVAHPCLAIADNRGASEPNIELLQSGKLRVVCALLEAIRERTDEKVLLTSNYCYTLDLLARLARVNRWPFLRVDGKVTISKRQELIDEFNAGSRSSQFLFLLSAKAGGAGLNITGASRLIIFEPSWNPAVDAQCCGRIWRLGQERKVVIIKLVGTSTIDELIVQRQQAKSEISGMLVERNESTERVWSAEELAFVASYDGATYSRLACERGTPQSLASGDAVLDALSIAEISHIEPVPEHVE